MEAFFIGVFIFGCLAAILPKLEGARAKSHAYKLMAQSNPSAWELRKVIADLGRAKGAEAKRLGDELFEKLKQTHTS